MEEPKIFKGENGNVFLITEVEPITVEVVDSRIAEQQTIIDTAQGAIDRLNVLKQKVVNINAPAAPEAPAEPAQPTPEPETPAAPSETESTPPPIAA